MTKITKSPLRYPGGKSRAVRLIASLVPQFDEYREPFLGGGSVLLYLRQKFPDRNFWGNDLHPSLFRFWQMCERDVGAVIKKITEWRRQIPSGRDLHRFLITHCHMFDDIETAAAFFILNRLTFSGTSESGGYSEQASRQRFTENSIHRLHQFAQVIQGIRITNEDFEPVIRAPGHNGHKVFIFLAPPYYSATRSALYGRNGHLHRTFDHVRFAAAMKNCPHLWLITYDDSPYIRELFSFATILPWHLKYGMRNVTPHSDQTGPELFISNYLTNLPSSSISRQLSLL